MRCLGRGCEEGWGLWEGGAGETPPSVEAPHLAPTKVKLAPAEVYFASAEVPPSFAPSVGALHLCAEVSPPTAGSRNYAAFDVPHPEEESHSLGVHNQGEVFSSLAEERPNHEVPPSAGTCVAEVIVAVAAAAGRSDLINLPVGGGEGIPVAEVESSAAEFGDFGAEVSGFCAVECGFAELLGPVGG